MGEFALGRFFRPCGNFKPHREQDFQPLGKFANPTRMENLHLEDF
jgi:hypothetical protein